MKRKLVSAWAMKAETERHFQFCYDQPVTPPSNTASRSAEGGPRKQSPGASRAPGERPLRKDAVRTRRQVMDAAAELFAHRGLEVGFDEIARAAGVGVGTVYRRFPDRDSLVEALFSEKVEEIVAGVSDALDVVDPWEAVVSFCERTILEQQRDRGLLQVLASGTRGHGHFDEFREQMSTMLGELLQRAQRAGVVRADLETVDLVLMTHLLSRVNLTEGTEIWRRYLALFLDAIRTKPGDQPLPEPVPTVQMFEEVAERL